MIQGNLDCSYPIHAHKHFVQPRSRTEVVCFSLLYLFFTRLYGHTERWFFFVLFCFVLFFCFLWWWCFFPIKIGIYSFPLLPQHPVITTSLSQVGDLAQVPALEELNKWIGFHRKIDGTTKLLVVLGGLVCRAFPIPFSRGGFLFCFCCFPLSYGMKN